MKLNIQPRKRAHKKEAKRLRREGQIPAILYSKGKEGVQLAVNLSDFEAALRQLKKGHLPNTVFSLVDSEGKTTRVVVKDVQYHPTTYNVLHLDFLELHDDTPISIKIPIACTGKAACVGVRLGGVVRQVISHLRVSCLPKEIPTGFQIDVKDLGLKQSLRLADIDIQGVRPLVDLNEVVVTIAKR